MIKNDREILKRLEQAKLKYPDIEVQAEKMSKVINKAILSQLEGLEGLTLNVIWASLLTLHIKTFRVIRREVLEMIKREEEKTPDKERKTKPKLSLSVDSLEVSEFMEDNFLKCWGEME